MRVLLACGGCAYGLIPTAVKRLGRALIFVIYTSDTGIATLYALADSDKRTGHDRLRAQP